MLQRTILLFISLSHICIAQDFSSQTFYDFASPNHSGEEVFIETDRQFYCIDERIYFTARYAFNYPIHDVQWSNVLYVELIRWNGEKITQAKFKLHEDGTSGYLEIPGTLPSGNYYVRAYTKWMRNFPVEGYDYKGVKVLNPFENNIDQGPVQEPGNGFTPVKPTWANSYTGIECFTDKSTYKQREKVDLTIRLNSHDHDDSNFCVSVAKAAYIDTNKYCFQIPDAISSDEESLKFLPEYRGISISGKVINADSSNFNTSTLLHLSTPQNWKYFTTFHMKDNGLFYFTLPDYCGQYEFYLDAVTENGERADILVDNDYCNRRINLAYVPFSLDSAEKRIALEMIVNMQLFKMYHVESSIHTPESTQLPFYGKPTQVYYTREYITLPNLEEFFYELVNEVRIIRDNKQTRLKLVRYSQHQNLNPLILLDNIAVSSVDEFLKIPLDRIEKVELFDRPYIITGGEYSGIICVSTKRNDFAGIDLPKNSQFFSFHLLSEGHFTGPDYSSIDANKLTYRHNLLFWDPDIELNQDQPQTLSFYTSDSKGEYMVSIRSLTTRGKPQIYGSCKIVVE